MDGLAGGERWKGRDGTQRTKGTKNQRGRWGRGRRHTQHEGISLLERATNWNGVKGVAGGTQKGGQESVEP